MTEIQNKAISALLSAVERMIASALSKAAFDVTKRGFITAVDGNTYSVQIDGTIHKIKSDATYNAGDTVCVLFIQNDPKNKFILGKVV